MEAFVSCLLLAASALLAVPVLVFLIEIVAAKTAPREEAFAPADRPTRPRVAVLVPAHNEGAGLLPTLADIKKQISTRDRLIVVADNCTDDTAAIAAAAGAEVLERHDPTRIGKGYALDHGLRALSTEPPDIVVMIDADCRLGDGAITTLASACAANGRPAQALYLMRAPERSQLNHQVAEFAWRVKNWARPLGLLALHLPCQLVGTGMAFPWDVIRRADLASGALVEDLELGLALARAGRPPLFCPSACVTSTFPPSASGARTQRLRWERGHVGLIATVPRSLLQAIRQRKAGLLFLALDLAVPPLSLLALLAMGVWALAGMAVVFGASSAAFIVSTAALAALTITVLLAWLSYGRDLLPPRALFLLVLFVFAKLGLYREILSRRNKTQWIRTNRGSSK